MTSQRPRVATVHTADAVPAEPDRAQDAPADTADAVSTEAAGQPASATQALRAVGSKPPITRAILEDRYDAVLEDYPSCDPSALQDRLWRMLRKLIVETAHNHPSEGLDPPPVMLIVDETCDLIRAHIVARVDELGFAR